MLRLFGKWIGDIGVMSVICFGIVEECVVKGVFIWWDIVIDEIELID